MVPATTARMRATVPQPRNALNPMPKPATMARPPATRAMTRQTSPPSRSRRSIAAIAATDRNATARPAPMSTVGLVPPRPAPRTLTTVPATPRASARPDAPCPVLERSITVVATLTTPRPMIATSAPSPNHQPVVSPQVTRPTRIPAHPPARERVGERSAASDQSSETATKPTMATARPPVAIPSVPRCAPKALSTSPPTTTAMAAGSRHDASPATTVTSGVTRLRAMAPTTPPANIKTANGSGDVSRTASTMKETLAIPKATRTASAAPQCAHRRPSAVVGPAAVVSFPSSCTDLQRYHSAGGLDRTSGPGGDRWGHRAQPCRAPNGRRCPR